MLKKILILTFFTACICNYCFADEIPRDYALVIRTTPIYESLELYADVIRTVEPGSILPLISTAEDTYGTSWAQVQVNAEQQGFVSDAVTVRMDLSLLKAITESLDETQISLLDQETLDRIRNQQVEVGVNLPTLLLSRGKPLSQRKVGKAVEYNYADSSFLFNEGEAIAVVHRVNPGQGADIRLLITLDDPGMELQQGAWQRDSLALEHGISSLPQNYDYTLDQSGTGKAVYTFRVPRKGLYRFALAFDTNDQYSSAVTATLRSKGELVQEFICNQRLSSQVVFLGTTSLNSNQNYTVVLSAEDGRPFSAGPMAITFLTDDGMNNADNR